MGHSIEGQFSQTVGDGSNERVVRFVTHPERHMDQGMQVGWQLDCLQRWIIHDVILVVVGIVGSSVLRQKPHTLVLSNNNRRCPRSSQGRKLDTDALREWNNDDNANQYCRCPPWHPTLLVATQRDTATSWIELEQRAERKKWETVQNQSNNQDESIVNNSLVVISLAIDTMAMNHKHEGGGSRVAVWMNWTCE